MATIDAIPDVGLVNNGKDEDIANDMMAFRVHVEEASVKVTRLEQQLNEVEQFYSKKQANVPRGSLIAKEKDKNKHIANLKKRQQDSSRKEAAATKRMQELMRQFGTMLRQLTQHKWAGPFMHPVDVEGLGLQDYFQVIEKPMDFTTIRNKMEVNDGTGYKNVREMCADVRLIFKNAMKYNDNRNDVHIMAKTLLEKFEEKWLQLLPKVDEEEKKRKEEEAEAQFEIQLAQEATHAKIARDLCNEIDELDVYLEELREMALQSCRKMSYEEKRSLMHALTQLNPDDLHKALVIISQDNPGFQATTEEVDIDIDAQSESTLWRLKFFVREVMQRQNKNVAGMGDNNDQNHHNDNSNKRKSENFEFLAQIPQKKIKKQL